VETWRLAAARENGEWCDVVARSHGCATRFGADAWTSATRTPPGYPDAVTLLPELDVGALLTRIDTTAGCSIKDCFAALDLRGQGFRALFEAEWIVHANPSSRAEAAEHRWEQVHDETGLVAWERAWRGDDGPTGLFTAELLEDETIVIAGARRGDDFDAGAILHRSAGVVGVSNVFGEATSAWSGCLAFAASGFPETPIVGYEHGDDLATARRHGFELAGPLRVWIRDD
jgi:hypothetical protein